MYFARKASTLYFFFYDIRTFSTVKPHKESCALPFIITNKKLVCILTIELKYNREQLVVAGFKISSQDLRSIEVKLWQHGV